MDMEMRLEELEVYQEAMRIGEVVWSTVAKWDFFAKDTVGKQWVRAADSMAANLSEGFGRFHHKENRQFGYYSRGSLFESKTWLNKAHNRSLVEEETFQELSGALDTLGRRLNAYIKSIGPTTDRVKESGPEWDTND
jgi:four helix bundle protein